MASHVVPVVPTVPSPYVRSNIPPVPAPALLTLESQLAAAPLAIHPQNFEFPQDQNIITIFLTRMETLNHSTRLEEHFTFLSELHSLPSYRDQAKHISELEARISTIESELTEQELQEQLEVIQNIASLRKNEHIKNHLDKIEYITKPICYSHSTACCCNTRLSHHLSKRLGNLTTTSKATNYLLSGVTLMGLSQLNLVSGTVGSVVAFVGGCGLILVPFIDSCFSSYRRNS